MHTYELSPVSGNVHVLAVWDENWKAYTNCYLIVNGDAVTLVDCGREEYAPAMVDALARLGRTPADVRDIVATHRHEDHVGGYAAFPEARKWIHPADWTMLSDEQKAEFQPRLPAESEVPGLTYIETGHHTEGSVAVFHRPSRVLLIGDHFCFGELSSEGLISTGTDLRTKTKAFIAGWAASPEDREQHGFDLCMQGLGRLRNVEAAYLGTGHGTVLRGEIQEFLTELIEAGN